MASRPTAMSSDSDRDTSPRAAFEALFESHHRAVLAYSLRRTRIEADAEDATAETFAVAWRRMEAIPPDPLSWLFGVARRVLANQRRGADRRMSLLDRLRRAPLPRAGDVTEGGPATAALSMLREEDQELLRLVAWEDLSHSQIATVLGISVNAVAIRLHRARGRYADALARLKADEAKGSMPIRTHQRVMGRDAVALRREERT